MDPGEAETAPPVPTSEKAHTRRDDSDVVEAAARPQARGQEAVAPVAADPMPPPAPVRHPHGTAHLCPLCSPSAPAGVNSTGNIAYSA
jgi:hypothetical protein